MGDFYFLTYTWILYEYINIKLAFQRTIYIIYTIINQGIFLQAHSVLVQLLYHKVHFCNFYNLHTSNSNAQECLFTIHLINIDTTIFFSTAIQHFNLLNNQTVQCAQCNTKPSVFPQLLNTCSAKNMFHKGFY